MTRASGLTSCAGDAGECLLELIGGGDSFGEGERTPVAQFDLGVEEDDLVDQVLAEESSVEVRAASRRTLRMLRSARVSRTAGKREATGVSGTVSTLLRLRGGLLFYRGGAAGPVRTRTSEPCCARNGRVASCGDAKVSVEDDAEQGAAARVPIGAVQVAAIGELWVVGQHGADAGENGVGGVAEDVNLVCARRDR